MILAPASIMITFSLVEATVNCKSPSFQTAWLGLTTNSPSTIPTCVMAHGPSKGMSEIHVEMAEPNIATSSGLHSDQRTLPSCSGKHHFCNPLGTMVSSDGQ